MEQKRATVALIAIGIFLAAVAVTGWRRATALGHDLAEARSQASTQLEAVTRMAEDFERMRRALVEAESALRQARRRSRDVALQRHLIQDCIARVADQDQVTTQTVMFGFLDARVDQRRVIFDQAEWYEETTSPGSATPHDYRIRNREREATVMSVAHDAVAVTTTWDRHNIPAPKCKSWGEFVKAFRSSNPWEARIADSPYWLTIEDGQVVRLVEQYLP